MQEICNTDTSTGRLLKAKLVYLLAAGRLLKAKLVYRKVPKQNFSADRQVVPNWSTGQEGLKEKLAKTLTCSEAISARSACRFFSRTSRLSGRCPAQLAASPGPHLCKEPIALVPASHGERRSARAASLRRRRTPAPAVVGRKAAAAPVSGGAFHGIHHEISTNGCLKQER